MIGYDIDELTYNSLVEHFVAESHIYPGFFSKVSSLTHFTLEPGHGDYSSLDQTVADFEKGLDFILTDSVESLELDASFEVLDGLPSSVSSGLLHLINTTSDTSKQQLAPSIKSHKLWCQAAALLLHYLWQARCQDLN